MKLLPCIVASGTLACGPVIAPVDDTTTSGTQATTSSTSSTTTTVDPSSDPTSTTLSTSPLPTTDPTAQGTSTTDTSSETTGCTDGGIQTGCDPWLQDCCPGSKCVPWANDGTTSWNDFRCAPIADPPDAIGDPCTVEGSAISGIDSCELGAFCFYVDPETNTGVCAATCTGSPDQPICDNPNTTCAIEFGGYITLCLDSCDPLLDDCDVGVCAPSGDSFVCGLAYDNAAIGEECFHHWDCASGAICTSADRLSACEGDRCCAAYCDITLPDPCGDGLVCDPWYREGQGPGGEPPVGVCVLE